MLLTFSALAIIGECLFLPFATQASTKYAYLLKQKGTTKIYLRWSGERVIHALPDAQTAVALVGKNWARRIRVYYPKTFSWYHIGTPIVSVVTAPISPPSTPPSPPTPISSTTLPQIGGCTIFDAQNAWNQDISSLPLHKNSATYIASISATRGLHPDFGEDQSYGIPFVVVPQSQPLVPITFTAYGDESDSGPYPIPNNAPVEAGDGHVLVVQSGSCKLYEMYNAHKNSGVGWSADSGAVWDLSSNALRPEGWTSADAAGLPIVPGLVRYDEVASGVIHHAIRFTAPRTQNAYIHPATHQAGKNDASLPPMGLRVRLKADYDISKLTGQARVIAQAMKTYGMILADNGSSWYFQGATDPRWKDDELNELKNIPGGAFEAVDTGALIK